MPFDWEKPLYAPVQLEQTGDEDEQKRLASCIYLTHQINSLRKKLGYVLGTISAFLPSLTDHSLRHVDKLRQLTEGVVVENTFSPMEVYCLNVAFLIHDACLTPVLHRGGVDGVKNHPVYHQLLAVARRNGSPAAFPTQNHQEDAIFFQTLRHLHAKHAQTVLADFGRDLMLNEELTKATSNICGPIAGAHHWPAEQVPEKLPISKKFPKLTDLDGLSESDLEIRPLYLALILRVVDACQIEGRAPTWMRLIQKPRGASLPHWQFQEDLVYTIEKKGIQFSVSTGPIEARDSDIWWMGYDYVREVIAPEIASATGIIAEHSNYPELKVNRVAKIETPEIFATINQTSGWQPVDIKAKIRNPLQVARQIGGEVLYGPDPSIPLRELIQNALDAMDARELDRAQDEEANVQNPLCFQVKNNGETIDVTISDHGIGMTDYVLKHVLPDFGRSFWSEYDPETVAGELIAKGLKPRGRFGIGFFSIFMLASKVSILTRSMHDGENRGACVLEFNHGLANRPLYRRASPHEEQRLPGTYGTEVTFTLRTDLEEFKFFNSLGEAVNIDDCLSNIDTLSQVVALLCPALNRPVIISLNDSKKCIEPKSISDIASDYDLFKERVFSTILFEDKMERHGKFMFEKLQPVFDENGNTIAFIAPNLPATRGEFPFQTPGLVVEGGLKAEITPRFFGIALGEAARADRRIAQTLLKNASKESVSSFIGYWKREFGYIDGKWQLNRRSNDLTQRRFSVISELLPFDKDFRETIILKQGGSANFKYDDWRKKIASKGKVIFFVPEIDDEEASKIKILGTAYQIPAMLPFLKPAMLYREFYGDLKTKNSITYLLSKDLTDDVGEDVKYTIGRFHIGMRDKTKFFSRGIAFYTANVDIKRDAGDNEFSDEAWEARFDPEADVNGFI